MEPREIVRELRSGLPIHRHSPDPEPRLTPLSVMCVEAIMREAADLIESLTAENAELLTKCHELEAAHQIEKCEAADYDCVELGRLRKELEAVRRERDAAIADMTEMAQYVSDIVCDWCDQCECECGCVGTGTNAGFNWRGVQEESNDG